MMPFCCNASRSGFPVLIGLIITSGLVADTICVQIADASENRPNIVLMMADQS